MTRGYKNEKGEGRGEKGREGERREGKGRAHKVRYYCRVLYNNS